jgi:uncharacterized protein YbcI
MTDYGGESDERNRCDREPTEPVSTKMAESWTDEMEAQLATELVAIHRDSYGKGTAEVGVLVAEDTIVVFLDGLELQPSEEFLIDSGAADQVIANRTRFQQAIEHTYRAAVERITGRRVVSFASATKLQPNYAVEVFRLAPVRDRSAADRLSGSIREDEDR